MYRISSYLYRFRAVASAKLENLVGLKGDDYKNLFVFPSSLLSQMSQAPQMFSSGAPSLSIEVAVLYII